uniref:Uncharacterized protein n=1 Tax=Rhizophora mucronata TaxID=61149 RepID=A0A2P2QAP4_RHIMU
MNLNEDTLPPRLAGHTRFHFNLL